jgi:hypothetical protein
MMQQAGSDVTVIAFIIMPAPTINYAIEPLRGQVLALFFHSCMFPLFRLNCF